jgi:hypothetical protein
LNRRARVQKLIATEDSTNTWSLDTSWGKYLHLTSVSQGIKFDTALQQPASGTEQDPEEASLMEDELRQAYSQELALTARGIKDFSLRDRTDKDVVQMAKLEALNDNRFYQPMDYAGACRRLNMDPNNPRHEDMPPTAALKSWQVTAVDSIIEKRRAKKSCVLLCDATGLGKTGVCLVAILKVSCIPGKPLTRTS